MRTATQAEVMERMAREAAARRQRDAARMRSRLSMLMPEAPDNNINPAFGVPEPPPMPERDDLTQALQYSIGVDVAQEGTQQTQAMPGQAINLTQERLQEAVDRLNQDMNDAAQGAFQELHQQLDREIERASGITERQMGLPNTSAEQYQRAREQIRERELLDRRELEIQQQRPLSMGQEHAFRRRRDQMMDELAREQRRAYERERERQHRYGIHGNDHDYYYHNVQFDDTFESVNPPGWDDMQKKKRDAEDKAQELLSHLIGKDLMTVYKETGRLFVKGKEYDYIIPRDGFIKKIGRNKVYDMCVHLERKSAMPETDNVIAMKLFLENNEKEALSLANIHGTHNKKGYILPACAGMEN
jgi:hypothetical protein